MVENNENLTVDITHIEIDQLPPMRHLTYEEAWDMFDEMAQRYANMSGEEFLRAWDAGEFDDDPEPVMLVAMMIDVIREP